MGDYSEERLDRLKSIKRNRIVFAVVVIAVGVALMMYSESILMMLSRIIGGILLAGGVYGILAGAFNRSGNVLKGGLILFGALLAVVGFWFVNNPTNLAALLPQVIGLIVLVSGALNLLETITLMQQHYPNWGLPLLLALLTIVGGILLILNAFGVAALAVRIAGGIMIYNGVSDLFIVSRINTRGEPERMDVMVVDAEATVFEDDGEAGTHQPPRN